MRPRRSSFVAAAFLIVFGMYEPQLVQPVAAADCSVNYCAWLEIVPGNGTGSGTIFSAPTGINCTWNGSRSGICLYQFSWSKADPDGIDVNLYLDTAANSYVCYEQECTGLGRGLVPTVHLNPGNDIDVFPVFNIAPYRVHLVVDLKGTGTGRAIIEPGNIDCVLTNGVRSGTCTGDAYSMTSVQLSNSLNPSDTSFACIQTFCDLPGVTFDTNQGGGTGTLTLDMSFWLAKPTKVTVQGSGTVVSSRPAGISCPPTCSVFLKPDSQVGDDTLFTAKPAAGWHVKDWGGACNSASGTTCTIQVGYSGESISVVFATTAAATPRPTITPRPTTTPRPPTTPRPATTPRPTATLGHTAIPTVSATEVPVPGPTAGESAGTVPGPTLGAVGEESPASPSAAPTGAAAPSGPMATPGGPSPAPMPATGSTAPGIPNLVLLVFFGVALLALLAGLGFALGRRGRRRSRPAQPV